MNAESVVVPYPRSAPLASSRVFEDAKVHDRKVTHSNILRAVEHTQTHFRSVI